MKDVNSKTWAMFPDEMHHAFKLKCIWPKGFTLIELLIVVAIIAVLAAIAIPNLIEAQTRAKVSRVKSDLRTYGVALEAYRLDRNGYPVAFVPVPPQGTIGHWFFMAQLNGQRIGWAGPMLTTPVAYLTSLPLDPFMSPYVNNPSPWGPNFTNSTVRYGMGTKQDMILAAPGSTGVYTNLKWYMSSVGPDRFTWGDRPPGKKQADFTLYYDPTNGTISYGDIWYLPGHGFATGAIRQSQ